MCNGSKDEKHKKIYLTGIGMGDDAFLTKEGEDILKNCDCIIGAARVTEALRQFEKPVFISYKPEEIIFFIEEHKEYKNIVIALSGDPGFYSGAKKLTEMLGKSVEGGFIKTVPGISSIAYLAAKLQISWEDAALVSAHGREQNYIHAIVHHEKTFLLLGGSDCAERFCEKIRYYGFEELKFCIGSSLSYEEESIKLKTGKDICPEDFKGLDVVYIYNPAPETGLISFIKDEKFIRGEIPMTKEEIRTLSIAKLRLGKESVLYDIGAGTGSVSIQAAVLGGDIKVYAVEKNPKGIDLIEKNKRKFKCDQIEIAEGTAPKVLESLPVPTHVFIGGSSGNLKEIIKSVKEKNPNVRIVMNVIALETLKEVMEAEEEGLLKSPDIVQITVARSRKLGAYHMMTGLNPVYIIAEGE